MANTGAMIGKQHQIRNSPVSIALANSPYTVSANISEVNVNTAGGNVRVNLPNSARKITVNKTSSDSYLVTLFVAGTQIGEIAGELSSVTVESGQITKDEPWYPYEMLIAMYGVFDNGGEYVVKNKFGKVKLRGDATTALGAEPVINAAIQLMPAGDVSQPGGGRLYLHGSATAADTYRIRSPIIIDRPLTFMGAGNGITRIGTLVDTMTAMIQVRPAYSWLSKMLRLQDFLLAGSSKPDFGIDFAAEGSGDATGTNTFIENVTVTGMKRYGILNNALNTQFKNCKFYVNGLSAAPSIDYCGVYNSGNCAIYDGCYFSTNYGCGVFMAGGGPNIFIGCSFEKNSYHGIRFPTFEEFFGSPNLCSVFNSFFEGNNVSGASDIYSIYAPDARSSRINIKNLVINDSFCKNAIYIGSTVGYPVLENIYSQRTSATNPTYVEFHATTGSLSGEIPIDIACMPLGNQVFINGNIYVGTHGSLGTIYKSNNSGSSTGTGSEQTIPHGLAAIPTGCKAWIRYPISATVYAEKEIRMDATNIYPKVKTGLAYDWRVE